MLQGIRISNKTNQNQTIKTNNKKNIMEQNIKNAIASLREEIAALEKVQKNTKEQRKTVNFHGERTMPYWEATWQAQDQGRELRIMYAAYGLLRGRKFNEIENQAKPVELDVIYERTGKNVGSEFSGKHPLTLYLSEINKILEKYGYGLPFEVKKNCWGQEYKSFNTENCEEVICLSQQAA